MTYYDKNALKLSHELLKNRVKTGNIAIDATAGRGRDTLLLSELVGEEGHVFAFDIQEDAIRSTESLLKEHNRKNVTLLLESHHKLSEFVSRADVVVFNFGFLPGGDHSVFSQGDTSIQAIEAALSILSDDGLISICSYYGGDTGFEERDALLSYLENLDSKQYTVMLHSFHNRKNCPPLFIVVEKNR